MRAYLPQHGSQRELLQAAVSVVVLYLNAPGTPRADMLKAASSVLRDLVEEEVDSLLIATPGAAPKYCTCCKLCLQIVAWQESLFGDLKCAKLCQH